MQVVLTTRGKRKFVTTVRGLGAYGIALKKAAKVFSGRFSASSSVTDDDEITITGDHSADIVAVITAKFPEVDGKRVSIKMPKAK